VFLQLKAHIREAWGLVSQLSVSIRLSVCPGLIFGLSSLVHRWPWYLAVDVYGYCLVVLFGVSLTRCVNLSVCVDVRVMRGSDCLLATLAVLLCTRLSLTEYVVCLSVHLSIHTGHHCLPIILMYIHTYNVFASLCVCVFVRSPARTHTRTTRERERDE